MFSDTFFYVLIGLLVCSIFLSFLDNRNVEHFKIKLFSKVKNKIKKKTDATKAKIKDKTDAAKAKIKKKTDATKENIKAKTDSAKGKINNVKPLQTDSMNFNNLNVNRISSMEKSQQINKTVSMSMDNKSDGNCSCSCSIKDDKLDHIIKCSCDCSGDGDNKPQPTTVSTNDVIQQNKDLSIKMKSLKPPSPGSNNSLFYNHMKTSAQTRADNASGQTAKNPDRSYNQLNIGDNVDVRLKGKGSEKIHAGKIEKKIYSYQLRKNRNLQTFNNANSNNLNFTSSPKKNLAIDSSYIPTPADEFYNTNTTQKIDNKTPCYSGKIFLKSCGSSDDSTGDNKTNLEIGTNICVCKNGNQESAKINGLSYSSQNTTVSEDNNLTVSAFNTFDFDSHPNITSIIKKA